MGWLDEKYAADVHVTEAGELTERELAVLLIPRSQSLNEEEQLIYDAAAERVRKIINLSVAIRDDRVCSYPGCHTTAVYVVTTEDGAEQKCCQKDLLHLIQGDCKITTIAPEEEPEPEPEGP